MRPMKFGITYRFGDIVLIEVPFVDKQEMKLRPALVLFEELDNVIVAGITSKEEGGKKAFMRSNYKRDWRQKIAYGGILE